MENKLSKAELLQLESQLSCPTGKSGIKIGKEMHKGNISMTLNSISFLDLKDKISLLEIGHGNCGHLEKIVALWEGIYYFGLEISKTMMQEAKQFNNYPFAEFNIYDGENIPFPDNHFDRIMTVNTIYFWTNASKLINEIERVLKYTGICVLTFADKKFMKNLPFVGNKFCLYDEKDIKTLISSSNLKIIESKNLSEKVISKTGKLVQRSYTMIKLIKTT